MKYLVIVESPSKCKKIEKYLNEIDTTNTYEVMSCMGHIRELNSLKNIDIENNFQCKYEVIEYKKKYIDQILSKFKKEKYNEIILACDLDREGEGICFHLCDVLNIDINTTKRIVFNEITQNAIKTAIENPRVIDINLVHAQQTRQILDLLVGFRISPILWKFISGNRSSSTSSSLSAGRCQTPALKLVFDNQQEIDNKTNQQFYNTIGYFTNLNLPFELNIQFETENELLYFLEQSKNINNYIYNYLKPSKIVKKQPLPFTTSSLLQVVSNILHYSPKETMKICQTLYEDGYITYMRTDSTSYSVDFVKNAHNYIKKIYGSDMYIGFLNFSQNKNDKECNINKFNTQDAHEAIRPTEISLTDLSEKSDIRKRNVYRIIRENTLESCMSPAIGNEITSIITNTLNEYKFIYKSEHIDFLGWKIVKMKSTSKSVKIENKEFYYLQTMNENYNIQCKKITAKMSFRKLNLHYTESRLIQLLEEKGIGRPSTFSLLIDKIQEREYVKKTNIEGKNYICKDFELENNEISKIEELREFGGEKSKLLIQPTGQIVIDFLNKHFDELFNYDYTSKMEEKLDKIAKAEINWIDVCKEYNEHIKKLINLVKKEAKVEYKLDENHSYIIGKYGPVIKCVMNGDMNGDMERDIIGKYGPVIKCVMNGDMERDIIGKYGPVIKCVMNGDMERDIIEKNKKENQIITFKPINKDIYIDINKLNKGEYTLDQLIEKSSINDEDTNKKNKKENYLGIFEEHDVFIKKGRFGLYLEWGDKTISLKKFGNRPIENIKLNEVLPFLEEQCNKLIRNINENLSIRKGPKGNYLFYKTNKMKKPVFYKISESEFEKDVNKNYKDCDINILLSWIKEKYKINI